MGIWGEILRLLPDVDVIDLQKIAGTAVHSHNPLTYLECAAYESSGHAIALNVWGEEIAQTARSRACKKYFVVSTSALTNSARPTSYTIQKRRNLPRFPTASSISSVSNICAPPAATSSPGVYEFYREMMQPSRLGRIIHLSALTCGDKVWY
jgi:hypothetical protein